MGDSYNDITMIKEADTGFSFRSRPDNVVAEFPELPVARTPMTKLKEPDPKKHVFEWPGIFAVKGYNKNAMGEKPDNISRNLRRHG